MQLYFPVTFSSLCVLSALWLGVRANEDFTPTLRHSADKQYPSNMREWSKSAERNKLSDVYTSTGKPAIFGAASDLYRKRWNQQGGNEYERQVERRVPDVTSPTHKTIFKKSSTQGKSSSFIVHENEEPKFVPSPRKDNGEVHFPTLYDQPFTSGETDRLAQSSDEETTLPTWSSGDLSEATYSGGASPRDDVPFSHKKKQRLANRPQSVLGSRAAGRSMLPRKSLSDTVLHHPPTKEEKLRRVSGLGRLTSFGDSSTKSHKQPRSEPIHSFKRRGSMFGLTRGRAAP